jgi:hypothetical protein
MLCDKPLEGISQHLIDHLRMFDFEVSIVAFGQDIAQKQRLGLISTLDLEAPFFEIIESRFEVFKDVLRHSKAVKFFLAPSS